MENRGCVFGVVIAVILAIVIGCFLFLGGGNAPGPTHVDPGNKGLVLNTRSGEIESKETGGGTVWLDTWERLLEVPTAQRTMSFTADDTQTVKDSNGDDKTEKVDSSVQVNTPTNLLSVDVSTNYQIQPDKARQLYESYRDQFIDIDNFEAIQLGPAVKEAVNYSLGDEDTMEALTTEGKQKAEHLALKALNDEWSPRGIVFTQLMIRGIRPDDATKELLSTTVSKQQEIASAKIGLQQQIIDNKTKLQQATADAKINRLQNSSLTDLYVQDAELGQVKKIYLPSNQLMGALNGK